MTDFLISLIVHPNITQLDKEVIKYIMIMNDINKNY
jgi:hypothetical protein